MSGIDMQITEAATQKNLVQNNYDKYNLYERNNSTEKVKLFKGQCKSLIHHNQLPAGETVVEHGGNLLKQTRLLSAQRQILLFDCSKCLAHQSCSATFQIGIALRQEEGLVNTAAVCLYILRRKPTHFNEECQLKESTILNHDTKVVFPAPI